MGEHGSFADLSHGMSPQENAFLKHLTALTRIKPAAWAIGRPALQDAWSWLRFGGMAP